MDKTTGFRIVPQSSFNNTQSNKAESFKESNKPFNVGLKESTQSFQMSSANFVTRDQKSDREQSLQEALAQA